MSWFLNRSFSDSVASIADHYIRRAAFKGRCGSVRRGTCGRPAA